MDRFLLIVLFFIYFTLTNAQSASSTSITNSAWFWPLLGISLALFLSIPTTLIILIYIFYKNHKSNNDSEESSTHSNSTMSERTHSCSRHVPGCRSPPPPYTTCDRPENVFLTSSLPPAYESHVNENQPTIVNLPPVPPSPPSPTPLDISRTLTSPSIQTFQA